MQEEHSNKSITMSEIMTPDMANFSGNIHGGHLLKLLDRVAYACAARYAKTGIVTLSVDRVFFKEPIHVGDLVTCYASINYVGRTSLEVGVKVVAEKLKTGERRHTNTCYFSMVAIDDNGKPTPAPPLPLDTDLAKRRFEDAKLRKNLRLKYNELHKKKFAKNGKNKPK